MKKELGSPSRVRDAAKKSARGKAKASPKMSPKRRNKAAAPSAVSGKKSCCKSNNDRLGECPMCMTEQLLKAKKRFCQDCNCDVEAMRKDCKVGKCKEVMGELEKDDQIEGLRGLHAKWASAAGPRTGTSRLGRFNWAQFKHWYEAKMGKRNACQKVMKTEKEFVRMMEDRGRTKEWAQKEFLSRRNDKTGTWRSDSCPDTKLPRTQLHGEDIEEDFNELASGQRVEEGGGKEKNPTRQRLSDLVGDLGSDIQDVTRETAFNVFSQDEPGMKALVEKRAADVQGGAIDVVQSMAQEMGFNTPAKKLKIGVPVVPEAGAASASSPSPVKMRAEFDPVADVVEVKIAVRKLVTAVKADVMSLETAVREIVESIGETDCNIYVESLPHLKIRLKALQCLLQDDEHLETFREGTLKSKELLPIAEALFNKLISIASLEEKFAKLGADTTCFEDLAKDQRALESDVSVIKVLTNAARRFMTVVSSARSARENEAIKAEEARVKALTVAAKKTAAAAAASVGRRASASAPTKLLPSASMKLYELDFQKHSSVNVFAEGDAKSFEFPWMVQASDVASRTLGSSPCRLNLMVFKAMFVKRKPVMKREHQVLTRSTQVRRDLMSLGPKDDEQLQLKGLGSVVHVFGYSKCMEWEGTELVGLASLRVTMSGSGRRFLALTPLGPLQANVMKALNLPCLPSITKLNSYVLGSMSQDTLSAMADDGVLWTVAYPDELSAVYCPAGWYMVERPLAGAVCGIVVSLMPLSNSNVSSFKALCALTSNMQMKQGAQDVAKYMLEVSTEAQGKVQPDAAAIGDHGFVVFGWRVERFASIDAVEVGDHIVVTTTELMTDDDAKGMLADETYEALVSAVDASADEPVSAAPLAGADVDTFKLEQCLKVLCTVGGANVDTKSDAEQKNGEQISSGKEDGAQNSARVASEQKTGEQISSDKEDGTQQQRAENSAEKKDEK
mmetsp:Transcript_134530/g.429670  ORF Transcript_134530/g.429670 Transcript_134530/m.429670 type:complete len:959 (-) Transcript_134530:267-3143(-)